jgi:outer membrane protein OmpA-like peptidoglycan-associated protein
MKAIKQAVIYHYSPLGILSMASDVFDFATTLRLEPLYFAPANDLITEELKLRLDQIADIMRQKPKISLSVCAVATISDITDLNQSQRSQLELEQLTDQQRSNILSLAQRRQQAVIDYLTSDGKVIRERLLGCNVKISDKASSRPQVKLAL